MFSFGSVTSSLFDNSSTTHEYDNPAQKYSDDDSFFSQNRNSSGTNIGAVTNIFGGMSGGAQAGSSGSSGGDGFGSGMAAGAQAGGSVGGPKGAAIGAALGLGYDIYNKVSGDDDDKNSGKYKGNEALDYMNAAYPGTTASERLGGGGGGSGGVQSSAAQSQGIVSQREIADKAHALAERGQRAQVISAYAQSPQHIKSALALLGSGPESVDIDSIPTNTKQNIEGRQAVTDTQVNSNKEIKNVDRLHDAWKTKYMENNKKSITNLLVKADMIKLNAGLKNSELERKARYILSDIVHKDKYLSSSSGTGAVGLFSYQEFNKGSNLAYATNMLQLGFTAAAVGGFMKAFAKSGSKNIKNFGNKWFSKMRYGKKSSKKVDITQPNYSNFANF